MLQAIRDRVTGWIAWIVVGLIGVTFALWGIDWYLQREARVFAASVNGVEIPVQEYRFAKQQQVQRMRSMLGERFDGSVAASPEFKQAVLDRLIEEELLVQAATAAKLAVSDALLAARIHAIPDFQEDGEFSQERYQRLLSQQGLTPQRFEQQFRRALLINQLAGSISGTSAVVSRDVELGMRLQGQERKIRYVRIPATAFGHDVEVKPEDVEAFYAANKARFVEPERVRVQYLELSVDDIAAGLTATEEEIRALYEADKARLTRDEQRRARHILIQIAEDAGEDEIAAARKKAEDLVARLRAGEDFAALAKEFSDDPGSAADGGDLGLFGKGMMVPEFEDAAFTLAQDQISDPVRSPFGFHIIQVTEIQAAQVPAFEEVREQLRQEAVRHQAEQLFFERAETLATLSFEQPDTLSVAAEQLDLEIKESDWLTASGGEGIGNHPKVVEAAFADDVIRGGNNSPVVEITPDRVVVLRMLEHKESTQLPLDAVRDTIQATLRSQAMHAAAQARGQALVERLQAGAPLDALAKELQLEMTDAGFVQRNATGHDRQIIAEAFRIPRTADGRIVSGGTTLANGDFVLVQVDEVRDGDLSTVDEDARTAFRRNLDQLYGTLETTALLDQLKARAEIVQHPDRLD